MDYQIDLIAEAADLKGILAVGNSSSLDIEKLVLLLAIAKRLEALVETQTVIGANLYFMSISLDKPGGRK